MAFFKFRKKGDDQSHASVQPESVEVMRRRAKYRLLGSAVLVLAGVVGFPMLFDKQPRPVAIDMPIDIPDKNKVKPLVAPTPAPAPVVAPPAAPQVAKLNPVPAPAAVPPPVSRAVAPPVVKITPPAKAEAKIEPKVVKTPVVISPVAPKIIAKPEVAKPQPKSEPKPAPAPVVKPTPKSNDGNKALALLEGRPAAPDSKPAAGESRFVVQVGAFSDTTRAREVRLKMEQAGIKTYTQTVETKDGPRIRVRAGPFTNKVEADRAAEKIKRLSLPASTLTL